MSAERLDLMPGTIVLLVIRRRTPQHGYEIVRSIKFGSGDLLIVEDRALYLSLHRLKDCGWIAADNRPSIHNPQTKCYKLTAASHRRLRIKIDLWRRYVEAVAKLTDHAERDSG